MTSPLRRLLIVVSAAALAAAFILWLVLRPAAPPTISWPLEGRPVKVVRAARASREITRAFPGIVQERRETQLAFRVGGPIEALPIEIGARVRKGALIAQIDQRDFTVRVRTLEAQCAALQARQAEARLQLTRYENLYHVNAVQKAELDRARAAHDSLAAQVEATRQQLQAARNALQDTSLQAPFDAYVNDMHVERFDTVQAGQPVVSLLDCADMEVTAGLPEELAAADVHLESFAVSCDAYPGIRVPATLKEFGRKSRQSNQTYPLTLQFSMPPGRDVRPGMAATVHVTYSHPNRAAPIVVPVTALTNDRTGTAHVWIYDPGAGRVHRQPVRVAGLSGQGVEIRQGLAGGELVVVAGTHYLQPGLAVRVLTEAWQQKEPETFSTDGVR